MNYENKKTLHPQVTPELRKSRQESFDKTVNGYKNSALYNKTVFLKLR